MHNDAFFSGVVSRLRAGDQDAATEVFNRFAGRLVGLARSRLNAVIRQKVDPEDVVQSVFRSFFVRHGDGEMELADWDSLWSLLAVITLRKCSHRAEYFHAARRDVHRQVNFQVNSDSSAVWEAIARDPTPAEAVVFAETVEQLMNSFEDRDRRIVELSLQGETVAQISTQVGCTERTVQRVLERVRKKLERMSNEEGASP